MPVDVAAQTVINVAEQLNGVDLTSVLSQLTACIPTILTFTVSVLGVRKAYGFIVSAIKRA